jgi:hypothetical protein
VHRCPGGARVVEAAGHQEEPRLQQQRFADAAAATPRQRQRLVRAAPALFEVAKLIVRLAEIVIGAILVAGHTELARRRAIALEDPQRLDPVMTRERDVEPVELRDAEMQAIAVLGAQLFRRGKRSLRRADLAGHRLDRAAE